MLPINKTYFLFAVDMLFYLTLISITLMFVYLQKLMYCFIIYSYKRNSSFSPCPWNLRLIGPSDFKYHFRCKKLRMDYKTTEESGSEIAFLYLAWFRRTLSILSLNSSLYKILFIIHYGINMVTITPKMEVIRLTN